MPSMSDLPLTAFDLAAFAVVALSTLFSLLRGAVREALTVAAWAGAIAIAYYGFDAGRAFARRTIETDWMADVAALVAVLVVPLIVFKVIAAVLAEQIDGRGLVRRVDRAAGVAFGLARGALLVCVAYLGLTFVIEVDRQPAWIRDARVLPYVEEGADLLRRLLPETAEPRATLAPLPASGPAG